MSLPILNLAAYQFSPVGEPQFVRRALGDVGRALGIKGTILVTPEGLNAFLAGEEDPCRKMLACLREVPGFEAMPAKESWSAQVPFLRFKVKVKKEIIRMDHPTIRPAHQRAPASPRMSAGIQSRRAALSDLRRSSRSCRGQQGGGRPADSGAGGGPG